MAATQRCASAHRFVLFRGTDLTALRCRPKFPASASAAFPPKCMWSTTAQRYSTPNAAHLHIPQVVGRQYCNNAEKFHLRMPESIIDEPTLALDRYDGNIFVITMRKAPENRLNSAYAQKLIGAFNETRRLLGTDTEGAIITKGNDAKFWCTGLELGESDTNPYANAEGFFPLLSTIVDFPFPTIALITGHTFGGAGPFALSHDYRVMNSKRGFFSMPPVDLGLHFPGIGTLPRTKLRPQIARKMLLEAHRWTGEEALKDGIVDEIAEPDKMFDAALELARKWAPKAKMGVYAVLRSELYGEAGRAFRDIAYNYSRRADRPAKAKI